MLRLNSNILLILRDSGIGKTIAGCSFQDFVTRFLVSYTYIRDEINKIYFDETVLIWDFLFK